MKASVNAQARKKRLKTASKALKQEYSLICRKDKPANCECTFFDLYSEITKDLVWLKKEIPADTALAKEMIANGKSLCDTEAIIMFISETKAKRTVSSLEIEGLKKALLYEAIISMPDEIKNGEAKALGLYKSIKRLNFAKITACCDPLHAYLCEADETYRESDSETQRQYRLKICDIETAKELIDEARTHALDLSEVLMRPHSKSKVKATILLVCYLSIAFSLAVGAVIYTLEWWVAPMLILPSLYFSKAIVDKAALWGVKPDYLWRLDKSSQRLKDEKLALVYYLVLGENADVNEIQRRLQKLSGTVIKSNAKIVLLADLSCEQAPVMPDDALTLNAISDMILKLNEHERGRYCGIIRKRSYSKLQEEYIGLNGRHGAFSELADFMQNGTHDFAATFGDTQELIGTRFFALTQENRTPALGTFDMLLQCALHPLNMPRVKNSKVIKGYGLIAPSVKTTLESRFASSFSRVFSSSKNEDVFARLFSNAEFDGTALVNTLLYSKTRSMTKEAPYPSPIVSEGDGLRCIKAEDALVYESFPDTPQRFYRKIMEKIRTQTRAMPQAFKKGIRLTSRIRIVSSFISSLVPINIAVNLYLAFWLYPPAAEFAAISGLLMWLLPNINLGLRYVSFSVVMLPTLAQKSLFAIASAVIKKLGGNALTDPLSFYLLPMLLSFALFRSPGYVIRLLALFFTLMPALLAFSEHESIKKERKLTFKETKDISQYVADSWKFFSEYVTEADNDLPPRSVQFSPVFRISHQTGPKEIGFYLLSCLSAYDLKLITAQTFTLRAEKCITSLEKLDKHRGCLFKSYNTLTLAPETSDISCEDMGVLIFSLICVSEGLKELGAVYDKAQILSERLERIISATELGIFYDEASGLLCKTYNADTKTQSDELNEQIISTSRLCSFYSVATQSVPRRHWQSLKRTLGKSGFVSGLVSQSGGLEDFFMAEIFLKSPKGSVFSDSLKYALAVHKKSGFAKGLPFGLSESGVHLFSSSLGYRTQKLGAPQAAVKATLPNRYCVSPHSSFLALEAGMGACMDNLLRLKKAGAYGSFGFFEAVDYTSDPNGEVVKCISACHAGQIIAGGVNALQNGIIQKRVAKSLSVLGALELLEESETPPLEPVKKRRNDTCNAVYAEEFCDISPFLPRAKLLSNGNYSLVLTDTGVSIAKRKGICIYENTLHPAFGKRGIFAGIKTADSMIMLDSPEGLTCKFTDQGVIYEKSDGRIFARLSTSLHQTLGCEMRKFSLKNLSENEADVTLLIYLEPKLLKEDETSTERKRLSLRLERDDKQKIITLSRAEGNIGTCAAIGFLEDISAQISFDKTAVFSGCDDVKDVFENSAFISPSLVCEPEPCVFIKIKLHLLAGEQKKLSMFILCADSLGEIGLGVNALRESVVTPHTQKSTKANILAQSILSDILFKRRGCHACLHEESTGLLAALPIIALNLNGKNDDEKLSSYLQAYRVIRHAGFKAQLAVIFNDGGRPERENYSRLLEASKRWDVLDFIYAKGGIMPIDTFTLAKETADAITQSADFCVPDEIIYPSPKRKPFERIEISKVLPQSVDIDEKVLFGGYKGNDYVISERPQVKWHHVLSNPVFGVVLDNTSLGKTLFGDFKEKLILELDGSYYDILNGAAAIFSPSCAVYKAVGKGFKSETAVSVSQKGMCRKCRVKITADKKCRLAYVFECGSAKVTDQTDKAFTFKLNDVFAGISADKLPHTLFDKEAFFSGKWDVETATSDGFCSLIFNLSGAEEVNIYLSFAKSEKAAAKMPSFFAPPFTERFESKQKRQLLWAEHQLLNGQIYLGGEDEGFTFARHLQNVFSLVYTHPERCKAEIMRCAYHQLSSGEACKTISKHNKSGKQPADMHEHLWLPLAVSEYISATDGFDILTIAVRYFDSDFQKESLYEHCRRAINASIGKTGAHGLVTDHEGCEHVWLSEFLIIVLDRFCEISRRNGDNLYSVQLMHHAKNLRRTIESYGKDSSQYIGGYLPFGEAFGSPKNDSCKISLLPQVLAQFAHLNGPFDKHALLQAYETLHDCKRGVTKLFTPPFDPNSESAPEEFRYLPQGIKKNGGQNTALTILLSEAMKQAGLTNEAECIANTFHPQERAKITGYKQEPYYICGEVYTNKNCHGFGADPIFNSAAAWYYRYLTEQGESE